MDSTSTLTLIHPTPPKAYAFMPNNMKNTTPFIDADPLYTITTDLVSDTHTHADDARTGHRIATITRRNLFPDTVTFSDQHHNSGKPISIHRWLQKHKPPDGYPSHVMQTSAGKWVWKSDITHLLGTPAPPHPSVAVQRCDNYTQPRCMAYLQPASPTAEPLQDEILVAGLILEQCLRVAGANINAGSGKFEPNKTVFGHYVHT